MPRRAFWRVLRSWTAIAIGSFGLVAGAAQPNPPTAEYQLKAVFLFNFAQFVEWPARAFAAPHAPLVIGVLGPDPFGSYLDELVAGEKVGERAIEVKRFKRLADAGACHILFIAASEGDDLGRILRGLDGRPILSVGDVETFSRRGGMIRFVTENGKIRMRINVQAAKAAGLEISSKLLRPATIVTRESEP